MNGIIGIIFLFIILGAMGAIMGWIHTKPARDKKKKSAEELTPSMILVNTVGTIMLREYQKVEKNRNPEYSPRTSPTYTYVFVHDNVKCKATLWGKMYESVTNTEMSVGDKLVEMNRTERVALAKYFQDAYELKTNFISAENEKKRQLEACDAIENLMAPKQPEPMYINHDSSSAPTSTFTVYEFNVGEKRK